MLSSKKILSNYLTISWGIWKIKIDGMFKEHELDDVGVTLQINWSWWSVLSSFHGCFQVKREKW